MTVTLQGFADVQVPNFVVLSMIHQEENRLDITYHCPLHQTLDLNLQ
jgi:hypothetical protein